MIQLSPDDLARWRAEIDLGVEFRDKEFGTYRKESAGNPPTTTLAGRNLDAFEQGARSEEPADPLNIVFPIVKNIVPTLLYQNPRVTAIPESSRTVEPDDAFYVGELLNRDLRDPFLRIKETGQLTVFDGYVLAVGLVKVGYATEFGADILTTDAEEKRRLRDKLKEAAQQIVQTVLGTPPKPKEPEPEQVHAEEYIRSESPYLQSVSPFDFVVDPQARDLLEARWCAQRIRRTLAAIKADRRYGKAKHELTAEAVDDDRIGPSFIEDFQTADVWEVHYKTDESPTGIRVLTFAATQTQTKALMHEDSIYDLGGWQFEWLTLNKHNHRLYPISTISVIRPLIERINTSLDSVLLQLDKFQAKIAYNERVSAEGKIALESPILGALVKIDGNDDVQGAIRVVSMEQVKADILGLINSVVDYVILITGLTRAQLTGLTTAQTATEAQIGQSGQNLRRTDEANVVSAWFTRVLTKYWRVKAQFQDFTEIDLPQEVSQLNPQSQMPQTQWYPAINQARADRLKQTCFRFQLDVGAMQKPNLEIMRSQFQEFMRALMEPIVTQGLALEGKRVSASEAIRQWSRFFMESGLPGLDKLVVPIADASQQEALLNYGQKPQQSDGDGRLAGSVPNMADLISKNAGEKGQGVPVA